jgi:hypothetical protein
MGFLGRLMGRTAAPAKPADRGGRGEGGTTERNVGGREAGTPVPPPDLPLDDDGNNARNIGG